jgi:hypothetical protein
MRLERKTSRVVSFEDYEDVEDTFFIDLCLLAFAVVALTFDWVRTHRFLVLMFLALTLTSVAKCQTAGASSPAPVINKVQAKNAKLDLAFYTELLESELRRPPEKWDYKFLLQNLQSLEGVKAKRNRHQKAVAETAQRATGVYQYPGK